MKIIIAGAGEVGTHLAKMLSSEDQDIMVIDKDAAKLEILDANYNLMTHKGSPISFDAQRESGVQDCNLFIAVTPSETENILACQIAKKLGADRTVARIDNYEYLREKNRGFFDDRGVDFLIYPEMLAAHEIMTALERSWARHWFELHDGQLILIGVKIRDNAPVTGKKLRDMTSSNHNVHVAAIKRNHETIIPRGDDDIEAGDIIYFTTTKDHVKDIRELCGKKDTAIRRVLVMGGSRIAMRFANLAEDKFKIKLIEIDRRRCDKVAEKCDNIRVVYGDARDIDTLRDQGIQDFDAFVALTDSSEANILTCLSAKELGVEKTVAEVEDIQFISQAENLNIGTIINKKLIASSKIFQILLDADTDTAKCLALADAEVAELEVHKGAKVIGTPVYKLKLPRDITLAGMIRDGRGMLISGQTELQAGDHVLVFTLGGAIHKLDKLFY